jgi:branched-chain amino acid aminotransferase
MDTPMTQRLNERVVYFNGEIIPESRALVSFRDRSFKFGDGAFDTTRTFGHVIFKLEEHVDRLYRSMRYLDLDPGVSKAELIRITDNVLARNLPLIDKDEDYWVTQRISRGAEIPGGDVYQSTGPTLIVECTPLPLKARAAYCRDGMEVVVPSVRRAAPDAITPRAKTHNYLNLLLGDQEVRRQNPRAWAILLDHNGNLSEGVGSNIFTVEDGVVYTPEDRFVLCGISRETVIEEAAKIGIPVVKKDIDLYDAYNADEAFITSTSFCVCPVRSINGKPLRETRMPGPVTQRIIDAYSTLVGFDFVGQYLKQLR